MRIAVVTTSYPAFPADGAGHFVRTEALELASQGHDVHVITPEPDRTLRLEVRDPLQVWHLQHAGAFGWPGAVSRMSSRPWRAAGAVAFMTLARARLAALNAEHVVAHWLVPSAHPIALFGAGRASIEAVAHGADVRAMLALPALVRDRIVASLLERGVQIRFVAHALRDALGGALASHLSDRLLGSSTVRSATLRVPDVSGRVGELRRSCNQRTLATVAGRMVASKRIELAIEAANLLGERLHLKVIGDGPELSRLRALDRFGNVGFLGQVHRDDALAWIAASDVLIHPSAMEAAPTVVREARSLGTPVVACASGDVQRWARLDSGITLVEPTAQAIARAVQMGRAGS